jgi:hypothetical protein
MSPTKKEVKDLFAVDLQLLLLIKLGFSVAWGLP